MAALGLVSASFIRGNKIPFKNSISQALPISKQTFDFSNPLPFKSIEQQKKEFKPEYRTDVIFREPLPSSGSEINREINRLKSVFGLESEFSTAGDYLTVLKRVQSNVFKPSFTSI